MTLQYFRILILSLILTSTFNSLWAQENSNNNVSSLYFKKQLIASESYEAVGVFDVNGNGILDIISGAFYYEGPDFLKRHLISEVEREGEYWDDFSNIPMDVNGNGNLDYITGS